MEESTREEIATQIKQEIQRLEIEIERLEQSVESVAPDRAIGRLTRMEAINAKSVSETNRRKAQERLRKLGTALSQLAEDEDYGICGRCDRPIPIKRLLLVPESRYCVRCLSR